MKTLLVFIAVLLVAFNVAAQGGEDTLDGDWDMRWTAGFNGMAKIVEAEPGTDAFADVIPVVAVNGGISFYYKTAFTINAPIIIIGPRDDILAKWDMTVAITFGLLKNTIMLGPCFDFGATEWDRSRFGALFSFGVEF